MTDIGPEVRKASGTVRGRARGLSGHSIRAAAGWCAAVRRSAVASAMGWVWDAVEFGPAPPQSGPLRSAGTAGTEWLTVNV